MTFRGRVEALFTIPPGVVLMATNNGGGPTAVPISPGRTTHDSMAGFIQSALAAARPPSSGAWSVTCSATTGQYTIAMSAGTFAISWPAPLANLLGFSGPITTTSSATGAQCAAGLWIPDCPIAMDIPDPAQAPRQTDRRSTSSPTGRVISHMGSSKYVHPNLRWTHVPRSRVWRSAELVPGASWQQFLSDACWAEGHPWFDGSGDVRIWDHNGVQLGSAAGVSNWTLTGAGVSNLTPKPSAEQWGGLWRIDGIDLESEG